MRHEVQGEIVYQEKMYEGCYRMVIQTEEYFLQEAVPGQFVHLKINQRGGPFLRRPLSIHQIDRTHKTISLLYAVVGKGTNIMCSDLPGKQVSFMGPLGNGFPIHQQGLRHVVLIGGGLGVAPLLFTADHLLRRGIKTTVLLGYAEKKKSMLVNEFITHGAEVQLSTDDGSAGHKGYPTDLVDLMMKQDDICAVFSCGPALMMEKTAALCERAGISAWVSLEEKMACGIGACLGCVIKIKDEQGWHYEKVCHEGPVFKASEVIFRYE